VDNEARIAELQDKVELTRGELREFARLAAERVHAFPSPWQLGVADQDVQAHRDNFKAIETKRAQARRDGYALEVIALDTHRLEFLLLSWLVQRTGQVVVLGKQQFGSLLDRVAAHGFRPELVERLRAFKTVRNKATHRLLAGEIRYEDLLEVVDQDPQLHAEVLLYVGLDMPVAGEFDALLNGSTMWRAREGP